jgi:hypothetical protein
MNKIMAAAAALALGASTAAIAQTTAPQPAPSEQPPAAVETQPKGTSPTMRDLGTHPAVDSQAGATKTLKLTPAQAKDWVGKSIYSSDGKSVGEVADFKLDTSGHVTEMHADIGGFLGIGETRVRVMPEQFKLGSDRIELSMAAEATKGLPKVES